jgi:transposase-like protein
MLGWGFFCGRHRLRKEPVMLVELRVGEQRYRAVWEVLEGASVTEVARRFGVSRQSVHF